MRNKYLENLSKIEFVVTNACTGRCKHCSEGEHTAHSLMIDPDASAEVVRRVAKKYDIKTVMTFGGEPLLHTGAVYTIMSAARELNIEKRQVITNGYFTTDRERMKAVAKRLSECGVNDLLLSVDAFHQETIPLDTVKAFAAELKAFGVPVRLQPAWLVSPDDDNSYNRKTREILASFSELNIPEGSGNVIFPEGNALKYLSEYFTDSRPENPYNDNRKSKSKVFRRQIGDLQANFKMKFVDFCCNDIVPKKSNRLFGSAESSAAKRPAVFSTYYNPYEEDPRDVRCISLAPDGSVLGGNIYKSDIMDILVGYDYKD